MVELFGLNIAKIVNDSITGAGGVLSGTLNQIDPGTRTPGDLTGGTNPTTTVHSFNGFLETKGGRRKGQVGAESMAVVSILGDSVNPLVVPAVNDTVVIEGNTYTLLELMSRDPASALYEFAADS